MDDNAARFMLLFRQHALRRGRSNDVLLSWREINWAYHSNSQDILVDMVSHQFHGKMLWEHARESGMFMWMTDPNALVWHNETVTKVNANHIACRKVNLKISPGTSTPRAI